jgi:hypothetical protein
MMKPSDRWKILCLGTVALLSMLASRPVLAGDPDLRTLCRPLEVRLGSPQEGPCLSLLKDVASRTRGKLTLQASNGTAKVLSDSKECQNGSEAAGCIENRLVGDIADQQFVVFRTGVEWEEVVLVSHRTGAETELEDWPHLSPGKKRFVVVAYSDEWDIKRAIAIFSMASDPPTLEWSLPNPSDKKHYYEFHGWNGDDLVLLRTLADDGAELATDLTLTAQGWQLRRLDGK